MRYRDYRRAGGLYRSRDAVLLGVCGGIAERMDFSPWGVRALFVLVTIVTALFPMIAVYIILGMIMKRDPLSYYRDPSERW